MRLSETWELMPYEGDDTPQSHTQFLEQKGVLGSQSRK